MSATTAIAEVANRLTTGPEAYIVTLPATDHEGPFPFMAQFELADRAHEHLSDGAYRDARAEAWPAYSDSELDVPVETYRPLARLALLDPPTRVVAALTAQLLDPRSTPRQPMGTGYPYRSARTAGKHPHYNAFASVETSQAGNPVGPVEILTGSRESRRLLMLAKLSIVGETAYGLNVVTFRELPEGEREDIAAGAAPLVDLSQSPTRYTRL